MMELETTTTVQKELMTVLGLQDVNQPLSADYSMVIKEFTMMVKISL